MAAVKKIHGVPPPRFNLVFQVSALFHHERSRFHHEWPRFNIVLKCPKPTSFLESPHLVLISFCRRNQHFHKPCLTPHLVFIIVNKCSCSYIYLSVVNKYIYICIFTYHMYIYIYENILNIPKYALVQQHALFGSDDCWFTIPMIPDPIFFLHRDWRGTPDR